jgi:hypothetical protein
MSENTTNVIDGSTFLTPSLPAGSTATASRRRPPVASVLVDAAAYFHYRLPEVFAGYDRAETDFPVEYPTASSPQAWASGTIPLLVRTTFGVRPDPVRRELTTAPPFAVQVRGPTRKRRSRLRQEVRHTRQGGVARTSDSRMLQTR